MLKLAFDRTPNKEGGIWTWDADIVLSLHDGWKGGCCIRGELQRSTNIPVAAISTEETRTDKKITYYEGETVLIQGEPESWTH